MGIYLAGFSLLGAAALLLRAEVGPVLVVRPVVLAPLLGATMGLAETGLLLGALLEWCWADRIPAGGIRTPAVSVGSVAGLMAVAWLSPDGGTASPYLFSIAVVVAVIFTLLFVPFDGGIRRLWNIASENVIVRTEAGSLTELRVFVYLALLTRWLATAAGLMLAPPIATILDSLLRQTGLAEPLAAAPWLWVIPTAVAALVLRAERSAYRFAMPVLFALGLGAALWIG